MDMLNALNDFLQNQGSVKGLLILFAIFMVWVNWRQNKDRLADKDREIARLSADVHDMRDRMLALWDRRDPPRKTRTKGRIMIEVLLLTALILHGLVVWLRLREMRRRDVALFHLHRVQARLMRVVSDGVKSGALSRPDYNSARRLMDALDALAAECRKRRSWMFNLREFRRLLLDYGKAGGEITPLENPELRALCEEAARARALVFFAHTPFLRSRIALIVALRLGAAFSKNQAAAKFTRPLRDAERFGVKVGFFGETASA